MNSEERKRALKSIIDLGTPVMTGIFLPYRGERRSFCAYNIPLDNLIYNKLNGRIGSVVKSYEKQNHTLDAENEEDAKVIEKFLWESKEDANKKTMASLLREHQQKYGIVTADGVIIDGNRRASLLNRIRKDDGIDDREKGHCNYFLAVILPEDADRKEVLRLETIYQMGEDAKVDYNPIEKYLKCKDLYDEGFTKEQIASFMDDTKANIEMYLGVLDLMNRYLDTYKYDGMYTLLNKNEDSFQKLYSSLKGLKAGVSCMWDYNVDTDLNDLELVAFDYIRSGFNQEDFRNIISKPTAQNRNKSIFSCKDIWEQFRDEHFEKIDPITMDEESVDEIITRGRGGDVTRLLRARDNAWKNKAIEPIQNNFQRSMDQLNNKKAADNPLKLLQRALDALNSVDTTQRTFLEDGTIRGCVDTLAEIITRYKNLLNDGQ